MNAGEMQRLTARAMRERLLQHKLEAHRRKSEFSMCSAAVVLAVVAFKKNPKVRYALFCLVALYGALRVAASRQLAIMVVGIYACYLPYGVLQEQIYKFDPCLEGPAEWQAGADACAAAARDAAPGSAEAQCAWEAAEDGESGGGRCAGPRFSFTLFLLLVQCCVNAGGAFAVLLWTRGKASLRAAATDRRRAASIGMRPTGWLFWQYLCGATPPLAYAASSLTYLLAMLASNASLNFVSYPTQALGKSVKLIPVMLMGVVLRGKKYSAAEYLSVLLVTAGVAGFRLFKFAAEHGGNADPTTGGDEDASPLFWLGAGLLLASLVFDGLTGPLQEGLFAGTAASGGARPTTHQVMLFSNVWALVFLVLLLFADDTAADLCDGGCRARLAATAAGALPGFGAGAVTPEALGGLLGVPAGLQANATALAAAVAGEATGGEGGGGGAAFAVPSHFGAALAYCAGRPAVVPKLLLFAAASAVGQNFIFYTLGRTSALTCTTITTTRKFMTILASVVLFPGRNVVNARQWGAVGTVFGGLALNAWAKRRKKQRQAAAAVKAKKAE